MPASDDQRRLLRHFLAGLAYRTQKAVRDAPADFADFRAGPGVRTPHQLLRHMSDVLGFAAALFTGKPWRAYRLPTFAEEVARVHQMLTDLAEAIERSDFATVTPERLLQGPLADAMTHAGQLAMLRRLAGSPIPPENFVEADIETDRLGPDQPSAASPDAAWYDAEEEPY